MKNFFPRITWIFLCLAAGGLDPCAGATEAAQSEASAKTGQTAKSAQEPASESASDPGEIIARPTDGFLEFHPGQHELTLGEVLHLAEAASPELKAGTMRETQAEDATASARAGYFPTIDFQAVNTYGMPGSSSGSGISGLMASSFRSGPAMGVVSRLNVFDLTREYGVMESHFRREATGQRTKVIRVKLFQSVAQAYFEAAKYRSQMATWKRMGDEIHKVVHLVERLVKGGQHSLVSLMLVQDQESDASIQYVSAQEKYLGAIRRLALLTGQDEHTIAAPPASSLEENILSVLVPGKTSPYVEQAAAEASAAKSGASRSFSENLPKVFAMGSVGMMSTTRLGIAKQDYAILFGLTVPIFEGMRLSSDLHRAEALAMEKDHDLESAKLALEDSNSRFDEAIRIARVQLQTLDDEQALAERALVLAKQRYLSFLGRLVDVREAIRNLIRIETQTNISKADLLVALTSKSLFNGGTLSAN